MTKSQIIERILDPGIVAVIRVDSAQEPPPHLRGAAGGRRDGAGDHDDLARRDRHHRRGKQGVRRPRADGRGHGARHGDVPRGDPGRGAVRGDAGVPAGDRGDGLRYGKPVACGAYTPTEALTAHEAGADFIKLFPADQFGPKYIQNLLARCRCCGSSRRAA